MISSIQLSAGKLIVEFARTQQGKEESTVVGNRHQDIGDYSITGQRYDGSC